MKYQKKPVEAFQVTAELKGSHGPFPEWALPMLKGNVRSDRSPAFLCVATANGVRVVAEGDYIVQDGDEAYTVPGKKFEDMYDPIEPEKV
jgi:hypothetical protein